MESIFIIKGLNKQGMVQVPTQVKGKTGTFTRNQWKRVSDLTPEEAKKYAPELTKDSKGVSSKLPANSKSKVDELSKTLGNDKLLIEMKNRGIAWKEHPAHRELNIMRAKMALKKHFESGGEWEGSAPPKTKDTPKKTTPARAKEAPKKTEEKKADLISDTDKQRQKAERRYQLEKKREEYKLLRPDSYDLVDVVSKVETIDIAGSYHKYRLRDKNGLLFEFWEDPKAYRTGDTVHVQGQVEFTHTFSSKPDHVAYTVKRLEGKAWEDFKIRDARKQAQKAEKEEKNRVKLEKRNAKEKALSDFLRTNPWNKPEYKPIADFLRELEKEEIAYYTRLYEEYRDTKKKYYEWSSKYGEYAYPRYEGEAPPKPLTGEEYLTKEKLSEMAKEDIRYRDIDWKTEEIKRGYEVRFHKFIIDVQDLAGEIVEYHDMRKNAKWGLDGVVIGTKNKVRINTVGAGGYNIQQFHFRTLISVYK